MDPTAHLAEAKEQLRDVQRWIAEHALNAPEMLEARALAAERRDGDRDVVESELAGSACRVSVHRAAPSFLV